MGIPPVAIRKRKLQTFSFKKPLLLLQKLRIERTLKKSAEAQIRGFYYWAWAVAFALDLRGNLFAKSFILRTALDMTTNRKLKWKFFRFCVSKWIQVALKINFKSSSQIMAVTYLPMQIVSISFITFFGYILAF